jgi:hypothetical protein
VREIFGWLPMPNGQWLLAEELCFARVLLVTTALLQR